MGNEASGTAAVACPDDKGRMRDEAQCDLPDRWCFGLAHPYMQRLIFLACTLEPDTVHLEDGGCQFSSGAAD